MEKNKTEYPSQIMTITVGLVGKSCLYIIEIEPLTYKFGISVYIRDRLKKHFRDMNFKNIVKIFDCAYDSTMCKVENRLKVLARSNNELINKYGKTEIIYTDHIDKYLSFVEKEIAINNTWTQPKNNRKKSRLVQQPKPKQNLHDNRMAEESTIETELKCYNCGKVFKYRSHYMRHANKKTPCIIREIAPEHANNPNRCIFCNKVLSNKSHLTRHLNKCKIKNGGMNILDEKVRYEQKIHILEEKDKQKDMELAQIKEKVSQLQDQMKQMQNLRR
jgi:uncharacterized C2H2 Zn-finger protein